MELASPSALGARSVSSRPHMFKRKGLSGRGRTLGHVRCKAACAPLLHPGTATNEKACVVQTQMDAAINNRVHAMSPFLLSSSSFFSPLCALGCSNRERRDHPRDMNQKFSPKFFSDYTPLSSKETWRVWFFRTHNPRCTWGRPSGRRRGAHHPAPSQGPSARCTSSAAGERDPEGRERTENAGGNELHHAGRRRPLRNAGRRRQDAGRRGWPSPRRQW